MHYTFYEDKIDAFFGLEIRQSPDKYVPQRVEHYTIFWIQEGNLAFELDFVPLEIPQDQIFFISPGQYIAFRNEVPQQSVVISFNKNFYCVERHDAEVSCNGLLFNGALASPRVFLDAAESESFGNLLKVMVEEVSLEDNIQREMLQLLLKRFIIKCTRLAKQQLEPEGSQNLPEVDLIRAYSALVEKHFREWHKVADYAEQLFRSPKTLSNLFRKYKLKSPLEIIQERIVLEGKRELIYTDHSIKEIAYSLGFEEPAQFSRYFSKISGMSPRQFRESW